jgi:hypothetical protein
MGTTSGNFDLIELWLDPYPRTTFTVTGYIKNGADDHQARTLCPHVLGYTKGGPGQQTPANERVLCWQLAGPGTNPQWRCYKVADLVGVAADMATPWQMGIDYSKHQICAKNDKYKVPYPP